MSLVAFHYQPTLPGRRLPSSPQTVFSLQRPAGSGKHSRGHIPAIYLPCSLVASLCFPCQRYWQPPPRPHLALGHIKWLQKRKQECVVPRKGHYLLLRDVDLHLSLAGVKSLFHLPLVTSVLQFSFVPGLIRG